MISASLGGLGTSALEAIQRGVAENAETSQKNNRTATPYAVTGLHEYCTSPQGPLLYDFNGNITNTPDEFKRTSWAAEYWP